MTRGNIGLALLLFSAIVLIANHFSALGFDHVEEFWLEPVRLVGALGLAIILVALLRRALSGEL